LKASDSNFYEGIISRALDTPTPCSLVADGYHNPHVEVPEVNGLDVPSRGTHTGKKP
jgi:hypothetical protein